MDELIVFLMREFGWTLEYASELVGRLPLRKLNALVEELRYQKALDDYKMSANFAMVLANWASAQGKRKFRSTDFIGQAPQRKGAETSVWVMAKEKGIKIPKGVT